MRWVFFEELTITHAAIILWYSKLLSVILE